MTNIDYYVYYASAHCSINLSQGKDSSDDEDMNEIPDDDQYDTEDSFIDDAELVRLHIYCIYFILC